MFIQVVVVVVTAYADDADDAECRSLVPNEKRQPFVIIFFINSFFFVSFEQPKVYKDQNGWIGSCFASLVQPSATVCQHKNNAAGMQETLYVLCWAIYAKQTQLNTAQLNINIRFHRLSKCSVVQKSKQSHKVTKFLIDSDKARQYNLLYVFFSLGKGLTTD